MQGSGAQNVHYSTMTTAVPPTHPVAPAAAVLTGSAPSGPRVLLLAPLTEWIFQNLTPSLRRLCSEVYTLPFGNTMSNLELPRWHDLQPRAWDRAISDLRAFSATRPFDLVISMLYDDALRPAQLDQLRALGAPVVQYHVDMNSQWYRILRQAPKLDMLAVSHMQHLEPLMRRGVPIHYMPMAASPDRYIVSETSSVPACETLFLGSLNSARLETIAGLTSAGLHVDIFGWGWEKFVKLGPSSRPQGISVHPSNRLRRRRFDVPYILPRLLAEGTWFFNRFRDHAAAQGPEVLEGIKKATLRGVARDEDVPRLMNRAKICLGINQRTGKVGERFGIADSRLRDFEAPLSGAFYLVQYFPDVTSFYRPGEEIETWTSIPDLCEKVRWYLSHPQQREAIASAGRLRAQRDHTWDARLHGLLHVMGLKPRHADVNAQLCPLRVIANYSRVNWDPAWPSCTPSSTEFNGSQPMMPKLIEQMK